MDSKSNEGCERFFVVTLWNVMESDETENEDVKGF